MIPEAAVNATDTVSRLPSMIISTASWGVGLVEVTGIGHCSALGGGTYVGGVMGDTGLRPGVGHLARGGDRQLALGHCSVLETGSCGHKAGSWHTIIGLCWSRIMSEDRAEAGVTCCPAPLSLWNVLQHLLELGPQTIINRGGLDDGGCLVTHFGILVSSDCLLNTTSDSSYHWSRSLSIQ